MFFVLESPLPVGWVVVVAGGEGGRSLLLLGAAVLALEAAVDSGRCCWAARRAAVTLKLSAAVTSR